MSHLCNCNTAPIWVSSPCHRCAQSPPCATPFTCDPCVIIGAETPMSQCEDVDLCTQGCLETMRDSCVTHYLATLPTIEALHGDTLASILLKIDAILRKLALAEGTVPTYNYRVTCMTNVLNSVNLNLVLKNNASQLGSPQSFANAASALAFLQTIDPDWSFTAPNIFHINSVDTWLLSMTC